jgi:hypothetical protein
VLYPEPARLRPRQPIAVAAAALRAFPPPGEVTPPAIDLLNDLLLPALRARDNRTEQPRAEMTATKILCVMGSLLFSCGALCLQRAGRLVVADPPPCDRGHIVRTVKSYSQRKPLHLDRENPYSGVRDMLRPDVCRFLYLSTDERY